MSHRSLLDSIKSKLGSKRSSPSSKMGFGTEQQRVSRYDSRGVVGSSSHWSGNPFADPPPPPPQGESSSTARQDDDKIKVADTKPAGNNYAAAPPPAYTATESLGVAPPFGRDASPAPSLASITSAEDKYAFLSTFDTIFVIDDSMSMTGRSWREVRDALQAITPICTSHDADGIDVFFLNHVSGAPNGGYSNIKDAAQVQHLFSSVRPRGATPTGARLHQILKPYVESLARRSGNMESVKPVNIIVITDGVPTDDPESIIVHHARKLDAMEAPPHQVGIQFFQVGNESGASRALRELDDDLADQGIRDMVDTVTWDSSSGSASRHRELTADGILKIVLGAVVRRLDRKTTGRASRDTTR